MANQTLQAVVRHIPKLVCPASGIAAAKLQMTAVVVVMLSMIAACAGGSAKQGLAGGQQETKQEARSRPEPPLAGETKHERPTRTDRYGDPLPDGALARLGTLRWRAIGEVEALAFAPDGKTVAAAWRGGMPNGGLCLFDAASGKITRHIGDTFIGRIAFSSDGTRLAFSCTVPAGGDRGKNVVQIWELPGGRKVQEFEAEHLQWLGWSAAGQPLAVLLKKGVILLRELATGKEQRFEAKDLPEPIHGLKTCAYSAGGKILAAPGEGCIIHVWDAATGAERCTLQAKGISVRSLALSADGRTLASLAWDADSSTVQLWDVAAGKAIHTVAADQKYLLAVAIAPDGKTLATVGSWGVRFWDVAAGRESSRTKGIDSFGESVAFSADGKTLATTEHYSGAIHLWDVATGALKPEATGQTNKPYHIALSPDGRRLASGGMDGTILVWDLTTGASLARIHRGGWVRDCAFSADGRTLFSCWLDDKLRFSDAATGRELHAVKLDDPDRPDTKQSGLHMYLSDDRKTLVAFSVYHANKPGGRVDWEFLVTGWDTSTRKQLFRRRREQFHSGIAISADVKVLAVRQEGGDPVKLRDMALLRGGPLPVPIMLEDLATGERLLTFPVVEGQTQPLAFSPDGRLLASNTWSPVEQAHKLRLWEVATASEVLALPTVINSRVAFSPDGVLAVAAPAQEILLWDLRRSKELRRIKGFAADVVSLAFSPDGRRLVSGLSDSTLLVWDVAAVRIGRHPDGLDGNGAAQAWLDLGGDARKALAARCALAESPQTALPLLKERLKPAAIDGRRLRRLLADLDSNRFAVRQEAQKGLEEMGDLARGGLKRALAEKSPLEVRQRIEVLIEKLREPVTQPEKLRALRALAVLEDINTTKARQILETLAGGEPEARLTLEAEATLERLASRTSAGS